MSNPPQYANTNQYNPPVGQVQYAQPVQYGQPQTQPIYVQPQQQVVYAQQQQPTVMYQQQPGAVFVTSQVIQQVPLTPFQTGLCDCGQDCCTFLLALFVPCVVAGQNEELKTGGNPGCACTCLTGCSIFLCASFFSVPCLFNWWLGTRRSDTRYRYRISGDACEDFMCHCCCSPCALTQESLEIRKRKALMAAQQQPVTQIMTY